MRARSLLAGGATLLCAMMALPAPMLTAAQDAAPQATPGSALEVPLRDPAGQEVGQAMFTEGALLVTDDTNGIIYRISYTG